MHIYGWRVDYATFNAPVAKQLNYVQSRGGDYYPKTPNTRIEAMSTLFIIIKKFINQDIF